MAIGTYLGKNSVVLIGRDTRQTAELVQHALISGLLSCGCDVHVLQGSAESPYVTTSTIAYATKHFQASAGIQVTASHNTPEYIGIKIWQNSGMGFTPAQEEAIDAIYASKAFRLVQWNEILKIKTILNANEIHVKAILERVHAPITFKGEKIAVVIDPGNGAACEIAPNLLQKLGANVITINAQPDGMFPGRDSEPNEENLRTILRMMRNDSEMSLGIAYDGDADRVRFIDRKGKLVEGDRILLLLAMHLTSKEKGSPFIVTPVNSCTALEEVLNKRGINVSRTRIGDIPVAIRIQEINAMLGGEISGTYTWPEFHLGPDALYTTAKLLEIIADKGMLEKLLESIPEYLVAHDTIDTTEEAIKRLQGIDLEQLIKAVLANEGINAMGTNKTDGVLVRFGGGFLLVRPSGTSPAIRLTCEHEDPVMVKKLLEATKERLARDGIKAVHM